MCGGGCMVAGWKLSKYTLIKEGLGDVLLHCWCTFLFVIKVQISLNLKDSECVTVRKSANVCTIVVLFIMCM